MNNQDTFICEQCQRGFHSKKSLEYHKRDRHEQPINQKAEQKATLIMQTAKQNEEETRRHTHEQKKKTKKIVIMLVAGFLFVVVIVAGYQLSILSKDKKEALRLEGIPSEPIHWHPHLTIIINGEIQPIPIDIGIDSNAHFPIHTHETDGTVHMENDRPNSENVRLGYFFNVWEKTFNKECIFDSCIDDTHELKMYVNSKENIEYDKYIMRDKDEIKIEYRAV